MVGLLVDRYLQSSGEPFNPSPYAIGGMLVKAAVAAFVRKKLARLRKDLVETYRYMDERERKRRWYIEQWFRYNRLKKRLDETATKVRGMVGGIDRLPCKRSEDLPSRAGSAHPVPDWRKQAPDPDPALQRVAQIIEEKRAKGEEVEDLMENLLRLMERWQQARARLLELRRRAGLDTGSIEVHGKPWTGGDSEARP